MTLSITYSAMVIVAGLGIADTKLSNKARIVMACVGIASLGALIYTRLNLGTVIK